MTRFNRHTAVNLFASLAAACLIACTSASPAAAGTINAIGVNNEGGGNGVGAISVSGSAGVVPQTNWNNFSGANGTLGSLVNSGGHATTASVTVSNGDGTYSVGQGSPVGGDQQLNDGFIYSNQTSPISTTITGIPYANYSLYVYELNDGAGRVDVTTLGSTTYYGNTANATDANHDSGVANTYLYTQTTSTLSGSPTANGDYVLFTGLHGSSQTFTVEASGNGYLNGFQIVQATPEPSSFVLLGLAGAGLFVAARRRRKA